jgi:hypothetical protein
MAGAVRPSREIIDQTFCRFACQFEEARLDF